MITIVDYNAGNLTSVKWALREAGFDAVITSNPQEIAKASRLVFPGVGAAGAAMENLGRMELVEPVRDFIASGKPFLGICIGCQILLDGSDENGGVACLGIFPGQVRLFPSIPEIKIPHMGWNQVHKVKSHSILEGIPEDGEFYFVHSYYPDPKNREVVLGATEYAGVQFASLLGQNNVMACQFHAEKSGANGLRLLHNFCNWDAKNA